jgi:hypothetical protein
MDLADIATQMVDRAVDSGQSVLRTDRTTPVADLRRAVRRAARSRGVRIRTGMVDDVLAVITIDADLWTRPAAEMRSRLAAPDVPNVVR